MSFLVILVLFGTEQNGVIVRRGVRMFAKLHKFGVVNSQGEVNAQQNVWRPKLFKILTATLSLYKHKVYSLF